MKNVLEKGYKIWREEQENYSLFDNQTVIIDCGDQSAREDFFENYLEIENLPDDTKFKIMLELEKKYEQQFGTLNLEKCKLAINEMIDTTDLSIKEIVKDVIQRGSRSNEVAEKNIENYSNSLNNYAENFKKLYLSPDFNVVSKEIELLTEAGSFVTANVENVQKELDNLEKAGYKCYYDNNDDRIHLENWIDPYIDSTEKLRDHMIIQKESKEYIKEYFNSIQDPWAQKLSNEKKGLTRD